MNHPIHRARERLLHATPNLRPIWQEATRQHAEDRGSWPAWCFLPLALWHEACADAAVAMNIDAISWCASAIPALGTWRMTQGIYRFDETVYTHLLDTPTEGDIPAQVLLQLPQWCIYVETPSGITFVNEHVHGFWAYIDADQNQLPTLHVLLDGLEPDNPDGLVPLMLPLGAGSVPQALDELIRRTKAQSSALLQDMPHLQQELDRRTHEAASLLAAMQRTLAKILPLLLYLCSVDAMQPPTANPKPIKTRRGMQSFPASAAAIWDVGVRMGAALRAAYAAEKNTGSPGTAGSPRGHIRRAHWHGFRSGPMKTPEGQTIPTQKRSFSLRWMPPIAVNLPDLDSLPATIHPVK